MIWHKRNKIIAVDQLGNVIESVSETLKLYQEHPGYSEQDPNEWFEATKKGIKELIQSTEMSDKIVKGFLFRSNAWVGHS